MHGVQDTPRILVAVEHQIPSNFTLIYDAAVQSPLFFYHFSEPLQSEN